MARQWLTLGIWLERGADGHIGAKRFPMSKDQSRGRFEVPGRKEGCQGTMRKRREEKKEGPKLHCAEQRSRVWSCGRKGGKTRNQRRVVTCCQDPEAAEGFQKLRLFWFSEEKKERPGMQNLRCRGAIVDLNLENGKFTSSTSCLYLWNNFTKRSYDI